MDLGVSDKLAPLLERVKNFITEEVVPMEIVKLKDRHKPRVQAATVFQDDGGEYVSLKDVCNQNVDVPENWEEDIVEDGTMDDFE